MSWSPRHKRAVAAFLVGGVAMLASVAVLGGEPVRACSAVAYVDISPIELDLDPSLEVDAVAACFGSGCAPVAVTAAAGDGWSVPQAAEYLQSVEPGSVTHVKVAASSDGHLVVENVFEVGRERAGDMGWPECPGPYHYVPVSVGQ